MGCFLVTSPLLVTKDDLVDKIPLNTDCADPVSQTPFISPAANAADKLAVSMQRMRIGKMD